MKITYLCAKHPPLDKRIYHKISKSLVKYGHSVSIISPNARNEKGDGSIKIRSFNQTGGIIGRIMSWRSLYYTGKIHPSEILIAPEPDSLVIAILLKKNGYTEKVIFDSHEWYNKHYENKYSIFGDLANFIIDKLINFMAKKSNAVLTVNESMRKKYLKVNPKTFTIPSILDPEPYMSAYNGYNQNSRSFIYTGAFSSERQKNILIKAAEVMKDRKIDAEIVIIGGIDNNENYEIEFNKFTEMINERKLNDYLKIIKWIPFSEAINYLIMGAGGITRIDTLPFNFKYSLPNKIFEYMAMGLPVIVSSENPEMKSIVSDNNCGIVIQEETGQALAEAIEKLRNNPELADEMGKNGIKSIKNQYNWKEYEKRLDEILNNS